LRFTTTDWIDWNLGLLTRHDIWITTCRSAWSTVLDTGRIILIVLWVDCWSVRGAKKQDTIQTQILASEKAPKQVYSRIPSSRSRINLLRVKYMSVIKYVLDYDRGSKQKRASNYPSYAIFS